MPLNKESERYICIYRTIVLIFIVIHTAYRPICPSTFFRCFMFHPVPVWNWCNSVLARQPTLAYLCVEERHLWVHPSFFSSVPHILFILLEWFLRWEVSSQTPAVLYGVASRICSKQHVASLFSFHQAFSLCVSLTPTWCIHTVVLTQHSLEKSRFILSDWSDFYHIDRRKVAVHAFARRKLTSFSVDEILLPRYMNNDKIRKQN